MIKPVTLAHVESITHRLAKELMKFDEPIPDFSTRFPGVLESCLLAPLQMFSGKSLYKGLVEKAAVLFYFMVKNHPFQNGNKRVAMTTMLYFLHRNGKWLRVDNYELYKFAVWVAESSPKVKDETIQAIARFIKTYLVGLKHT
jgi:death-on-curing protein